MSFRNVTAPEVRVLGVIPSVGAFGPDTVVAFSQELVGKDADIQHLLGAINEQAADDIELKEKTFKKHLSGIGRGHALDGLPVVAFAIKGSKMLDSALTGAVYSRALASSSRRKQATIEDLFVPESFRNTAFFKSYKEVNERIFAHQSDFAALGKPALATFNKLRAYNDTCEMLYVVPLSTLVNLTVNVNTQYTPMEVQLFVKMLPDLLRPYGLDQMYKLRCAVPRETYQHFTVFTDPNDDNWVAQCIDPNVDACLVKSPQVMFDTSSYMTLHATDLIRRIKKRITAAEEDSKTAPKADRGGFFYEAVMENAQDLSKFTRSFNEALFVRTRSAISWRVWSEQKRHGTLKQQVISVYAAAHTAARGVEKLFDTLEDDTVHEYTADERILFAKFFAMDPVFWQKDHAKLCDLYVDLTLRQMQVFFQATLNKSFAVDTDALLPCDLLYCVPRNLILHTIETYDAMNLFSLELPLRLCSTCEVEREATSAHKAEQLGAALPPAYNYLLQPKCNLGYCPEAQCCGRVKQFNPFYTDELHRAIAKHIEKLGRA